MTTETLLLNRGLGFAVPQDYVSWAVDRLCEGDDGQALCILAGLNVELDREDVERYFRESCAELGIEVPSEPEIPRDSAVYIQQGYERGELTAGTALGMMEALYSQSGYSDPLLAIWLYVQEDLSLKGSGYEGCFYPPELLEDLDALFEREWELYRRAAALELPEGFLNFIECSACGHVGKPVWRQRSVIDGIKACFSGRKPPQSASCSECGSFEYCGITDPRARDRYFTRIEGEQSAARD